MFTLTIADGGPPRTFEPPNGRTSLGRAPSCGLVLIAPGVSRQHAWLQVGGGRAFLRDAGSRYGTILNGKMLAGEEEIHAGDVFEIGEVSITVDHAVTEKQVLSERTPVMSASATIVRRVDDLLPPVPVPAGGSGAPAAPYGAFVERRKAERRKVDAGRPSGQRRSGRDRRGGRLLRLLTEIGRTLVTVQPLPQVLARVGDLVFDAVSAERVFLMLRDSYDQPLTARVMRNRDGSTPENVSLSRTIVSTVMRDRVAMLATDALADSRLDAAASIHMMSIRSFMCAPLWNRSEVIGVLYCDNPLSRKFTEDDLEVFTALCNYAAVSIEQARLSQQLLDETTRRERLQRYHSPGVVKRILHTGGAPDGSFAAQEREVSVMFCDIVGFTGQCEHMAPSAVGAMLNAFFGRMCDVIFEHEGTLDKFIGDAILAVFGAPFEQKDHAVRSVAAALAMRAALERFNADRPERPIQIRIAINSGAALTGDIGSPRRKEFTVLGDVVNTASRMESSVAKPGQIVISQNTRALVGDTFRLESLGRANLRGRASNLEMFEVLG